VSWTAQPRWGCESHSGFPGSPACDFGLASQQLPSVPELDEGQKNGMDDDELA